MKHTFQHAESPTWCIHCGRFSCYDDGDCDAPQTARFDTRTEKGFETVAKIITGRCEAEAIYEAAAVEKLREE